MIRLASLTATVAALTIAASPLAAQQRNPGRAPQLRARVEEAFMRRARNELGLTDDQATRVGRALEASGARRRELDETDRTARQALAAQLRPGIAANADSVTRLLDIITSNRVAHAETFRSEMRDLAAILTPVQRGQFLLMRDRMFDQVREMMNGGAAEPGRPPR